MAAVTIGDFLGPHSEASRTSGQPTWLERPGVSMRPHQQPLPADGYGREHGAGDEVNQTTANASAVAVWLRNVHLGVPGERPTRSSRVSTCTSAIHLLDDPSPER